MTGHKNERDCIARDETFILNVFICVQLASSVYCSPSRYGKKGNSINNIFVAVLSACEL
jgi:hypothetical protein